MTPNATSKDLVHGFALSYTFNSSNVSDALHNHFNWLALLERLSGPMTSGQPLAGLRGSRADVSSVKEQRPKATNSQLNGLETPFVKPLSGSLKRVHKGAETAQHIPSLYH